MVFAFFLGGALPFLVPSGPPTAAELQLVLEWDGRSPTLIPFAELARRCEAGLAQPDQPADVRFGLAFRLASIRYYERIHGAAVAAIEQALKIRPDHPEALCRLGQLRLREPGKVGEVAEIAARLIKDHPLQPYGYFLDACRLRDQNQGAAALGRFDKAIELGPRFSPALFWRAYTQYEARQYERCLADVRAVLTLAPSAEDDPHRVLLLFASCLFHLERFDEAAAVLVHLHQQNPASWEVNYPLWICQGQLRQFANALALTERIEKSHPSDERTHWLRARSLAQAGELAPAERHARQAVQLAPESQAAWTALGAVLHLRGKTQEGLDAYQMALRVGPPNPDTLLRAAFVFATSPLAEHRRPSVAKKLAEGCTILLTAARPRGQALMVLALAQHEDGERETAQKTFQEAAKLVAPDPHLRASCNLLAEQLRRGAPYRLDPSATRNAPFLLAPGEMIRNPD